MVGFFGETLMVFYVKVYRKKRQSDYGIKKLSNLETSKSFAACKDRRPITISSDILA